MITLSKPPVFAPKIALRRTHRQGFKRGVLGLSTVLVLLSSSSASAHTDQTVTLSEDRIDVCREGDTCTNTFDASWDAERVVGPVGGTLKVEATGAERSSQEFTARFSMVVAVPPNTREITLSSAWRLVGLATAAGQASAGCSVAHSQVNYIAVTPIFYAYGMDGLVPIVGYGVPVSPEFTFTQKLTSSNPFPKQMTLWTELRCSAHGSHVTSGAPSSAEVTLTPDSADTRGTALLHLHATFGS